MLMIILGSRASLFRMLALETAVTKNRLMHPVSKQTPYLWAGNVFWYNCYLRCNITLPGFLCINVMILDEILTVDYVITHLWRHYFRLDDVKWLSSTCYDWTYPFIWSCHVLSQREHFLSCYGPTLWSREIVTAVSRVTIQINVILVSRLGQYNRIDTWSMLKQYVDIPTCHREITCIVSHMPHAA